MMKPSQTVPERKSSYLRALSVISRRGRMPMSEDEFGEEVSRLAMFDLPKALTHESRAALEAMESCARDNLSD